MIKIRPVLFLDIDGPMIPGRSFFLDQHKFQDKVYKKLIKLNELDYGGVKRFKAPLIRVMFDPVAVAMLNRVLEETNAWLVIHSSWSKSFSGKQMRLILKEQGVNYTHLHKDWTTPKKFTSHRGHEIGWWLRDHPKVKEFVIVDDSTYEFNYFEALKSRLVVVTDQDGFQLNHYQQMLDRLGYKIPEIKTHLDDDLFRGCVP